MRECLAQLASTYEVTSIQQMLTDIIEPMDDGDDEEVAVPIADFDITTWRSGVEQYHDWTPAQMWHNLGLPAKRIPYFNEYEDPDAINDPWSREFETWLEEQETADEPTRRELTPRWHQLVGIFKMIVNMFEKRPVLLMDEVGVGKTLQVIGFIAMRAYLFNYHEEHGTYPGYFGKHQRLLAD